MWGFARWALVLISGYYLDQKYSNVRPVDDSDPWIIGYPIDPVDNGGIWDFGPWKGRKEDEWIIGGVLLFIILQSKFWK